MEKTAKRRPSYPAEHYEMVAELYRKHGGRSKAVQRALVAKGINLPIQSVRNHIFQARQRGLLAPLERQPRVTSVSLRLTESGVRHIDAARGDLSRSAYVREALALAAKHGLKGPGA